MPTRLIIRIVLVSSIISGVLSTTFAVLLTMRLLATTAYGQSAAPVLRAERVEIVNAQGSVVARLGARENSGAFATADAPGMVFLDQTGLVRAAIGVQENGVPQFAIISSQRTYLGMQEAVTPDGLLTGRIIVVLADGSSAGPATGRPSFALTGLHGGGSAMQFLHTNGQVAWQAP